MTNVVNVVMGGVFHASILFLVAAGLQVVFGVQKVFNLACGSFYALGAYFGVSAVSWYMVDSRSMNTPRFYTLGCTATNPPYQMRRWV